MSEDGVPETKESDNQDLQSDHSVVAAVPASKPLGKGWSRMKSNLAKVKFLNKVNESNTTDAEDRIRGYLSFVPSLLVSQLEEQKLSVGQSFPQAKHSQSFSSRGAVIFPQAKHRHGVLFFADLSGFTKLTEKLAVQSHGAELLCAELDKVIRMYIYFYFILHILCCIYDIYFVFIKIPTDRLLYSKNDLFLNVNTFHNLTFFCIGTFNDISVCVCLDLHINS